MLRKILLDPRTPLVVGIVLVTVVVWMLYISAPLPGGLADAHAQIHELNTLAGCQQCHDSSSPTAGCLSCHVEIAAQLREEDGYHAYLLQGKPTSCTGCHAEHNGSSFPLISRLSWPDDEGRRFDHPHVQFALTGAHDVLDCEACHGVDQRPPFALPDFPALTRTKSFLGLRQQCSACHADPHAGGLVDACDACHGQDAFVPTESFDHGHLPLEGGHGDLSCDQCHRFPELASTPLRRELPFPFDSLRGTTCQECHDSPHRIVADACDQCHDGTDLRWRRAALTMDRQRHEQLGFPLVEPHARLECSACHDPARPFADRHHDPTAPGYDRGPDSCQGCHEDAHGGQFGSRPQCIDCHERQFFDPTGFGVAHHQPAFPLTGAHQGVPCSDCHPVDATSGVRTLVGIEQTCQSCHPDPHAGQFAQQLQADGCESCHTETRDSFRIPDFPHDDRTDFALRGVHRRTDCNGCHIRAIPTGSSTTEPVLARQYENTPDDCASCHRDVHRGQFAGRESCASCHSSFRAWSQLTFDHDTESRFPLRGNHSAVPCASCHKPVPLPDGGSVVQYRPLGKECSDCHGIP